MSDNLRRYRAIRDALMHAYPTPPTGNFARHVHKPRHDILYASASLS